MIETGVDRTPRTKDKRAKIAQTPKTVPQIKSLLDHFFVVSMSLLYLNETYGLEPKLSSSFC